MRSSGPSRSARDARGRCRARSTKAEVTARSKLAARRVAGAIERTLNPEGLNLVQANGPAAGQSVFHFHIHLLPRRKGDDLKLNWGYKAGDMDAIGALAERIRENVG